jgi:hypothetical protein
MEELMYKIIMMVFGTILLTDLYASNALAAGKYQLVMVAQGYIGSGAALLNLGTYADLPTCTNVAKEADKTGRVVVAPGTATDVEYVCVQSPSN